VKNSLKVLAIYREIKYSNRAVVEDQLILDEVIQALMFYFGENIVITKIHPEDIASKLLSFNYDLVFSMAQEENILAYLDLLESRGAIVLNSSKSVRNCFRSHLSLVLQDPIFSYPNYIQLKVEPYLFKVFNSPFGYWVKRGDFHALADNDVIHIDSIDYLSDVLSSFKSRGVEEVILQKSVKGELFKFYGVKDKFFQLRYIGKTNSNRYINLPGNSNVSFNRELVESLAHKAANLLELDFYGGDCVITTEGEIHFIDFNDWPSFRTCRQEVAIKMVEYALLKLKSEENCVSSSL
jgi:hypothetical protein